MTWDLWAIAGCVVILIALAVRSMFSKPQAQTHEWGD